jgi:hypothetical protein
MSKLLTLFVALATATTVNADGAVSLDESNFAEMTKGKNSFIMFLGHGCHHCEVRPQ